MVSVSARAGVRSGLVRVHDGVWFKVKQGMRGLLVRDRMGAPVVYLLCEPATRYYQVMTRSDWMPALLGEVI